MGGNGRLLCHFADCPLFWHKVRIWGIMGSVQTKPMRTGHYLVACPALNEREEVSDCYTAADVCYAMHQESGAYAYVEDYLGHTYMEYGECV